MGMDLLCLETLECTLLLMQQTDLMEMHTGRWGIKTKKTKKTKKNKAVDDDGIIWNKKGWPIWGSANNREIFYMGNKRGYDIMYIETQ